MEEVLSEDVIAYDGVSSDDVMYETEYDYNFSKEKTGLSNNAILGIVVVVCVILGIVLGIIFGKRAANK